MKSTSTSSKNNTTFNTKSKKNPKDREKRKSIVGYEKNETHNTNEKGSPCKDSSIRKYAGIGPESVSVYSEQSTFEHLSEEVCSGLAEDLSYKLRYIIHDALIKARLSGRNHILSSDIDATFIDLNIDKIYGTSSAPNWIALGDQNCYYLEDPVVNLIDISEQDCSYIQPGDVSVVKKWLPDNKDSKALKTYFETMCLAIVSNDMVSRNFALNDIKSNNFIGPIVKWFYNFGYFLLSKDITYDCLTLSALNLINALERNSVAPLCVTEKQLKLLIRLILQRLLRSLTTIEVLKPMCSTLAMLCQRLALRELVLTKLNQKIAEAKDNFIVPILYILNALGIDAIDQIFIPDMDFLLIRAEHDHNPDLTAAILETYFILCQKYDKMKQVNDKFYLLFGDSLCPLWGFCDCNNNNKVPDRIENNWFNMKSQLLKSRKRIQYVDKPVKTYHIRDVFPDYNDGAVDCDYNSYHNNDFQNSSTFGWNEKIPKNAAPCPTIGNSFACGPTGWEAVVPSFMEFDNNSQHRISFQLTKSNRMKAVSPDFIESLMKVDSYSPGAPEISLLSNFMNSQQKHIISGKRTLLISSFRNFKYKGSVENQCYNHSLKYCNL